MDVSVTFKSDLFKPFLPDEAQVNPGCLGAELAWWLAAELARRGVFTSYPNYEDWGWFLQFNVDEDEYWLCCGNAEGAEDRWRIFLEPQAKGFFGRRAPVEPAGLLMAAVRELLEENQAISEINWAPE